MFPNVLIESPSRKSNYTTLKITLLKITVEKLVMKTGTESPIPDMIPKGDSKPLV